MADYGSGQFGDHQAYERGPRARSGYDPRHEEFDARHGGHGGYGVREDEYEYGYRRANDESYRAGYPDPGRGEPYGQNYRQAGPPPTPTPTSNKLKYVLVGCGVFVLLASCSAIVGGSDEPATVTTSSAALPSTASTGESAPTLVPVSQAPAAAPPVEQPPAPVEAAAPAEPAANLDVTVANVVGMDLQSAQELLFPALRTTSYDATGQGRMQLVDSNWVVVSQEPAAGSVVLTFTDVKLYVKKIGE